MEILFACIIIKEISCLLQTHFIPLLQGQLELHQHQMLEPGLGWLFNDHGMIEITWLVYIHSHLAADRNDGL